MTVKCLNCGHEFETTEIEEDDLGLHCICEECGASFDVDENRIFRKGKMNMKIGDKVIVKDNLKEELCKLTFDESTCECMAEHFVGTKQEIFALWKNEDGQEYATVDLCCEIPVQCLEVI